MSEVPETPKMPPGCGLGIAALVIGLFPAFYGPIQVANECGSNASESTCGAYMWPFMFVITLPIGLLLGIGAITANARYKKDLNPPAQINPVESTPAPAESFQSPQSKERSSVYAIVLAALSFIFNGMMLFIFSVPAVLLGINARQKNEPQGKIALIIACIALGLNIFHACNPNI